MPDGPELNMTAPSSQSPLPLASSSPLSPIPGQDVEVHLLEAAPLVATNRSVHFDDTEPVVFETFAKSEYERVMDAGPEFSHVSELFEANGELKEQEQEQEVVESLEPLRWLGVCVERRPHQLGFGMKLACVPRLSPASPAYLYAEAVIIQVKERSCVLCRFRGCGQYFSSLDVILTALPARPPVLCSVVVMIV